MNSKKSVEADPAESGDGAIATSSLLDVVGHSINPEYETIGPLWANLFATLRLSLGDFDFSAIMENQFYYMHV
ncbi:MAG: hypothetical protein VXW79_03885, partial [Bacteroidota bacterium]|nr:hypothetical protein [Bacteroidota bacterium]